MHKRGHFDLALVILASASWLLAGLLWGPARPEPASNWAIAFWLFASALVLIFMGVKYGVGIPAGLLILAGLFLPNSSLVAHPAFVLVEALPNILGTLLFYMLFLALFTAALLLQAGINCTAQRREEGLPDAGGSPAQGKRAGRAGAAYLVLSALILIKTLDNFYWLTIWDRANDSMGYFLLVGPVSAVLFSGAMLSVTLRERAKLAGVYYALGVLALVFAVSASAENVDFRQLTEARAGQVSQAVEAYHAQAGHYPQDLRELTPGSMLTIPGPVIIYGQGWCYQGGDDDYQLGYIDRDHWSSPILTGQVYAGKGQAADPAHLCDGEMAVLRKNYPDYSWWQYAMKGE